MKKEKEFWRWPESRWTAPDINWKSGEIISAGVDVGSVSSQAVIMVDGQLFCYSNIRTGSNSPESSKKTMDNALKDTGLTLDNIHYTVGTGYGRVNVPFAKRALTEIACHARGANFMYGPSVRTILDMGGQDCKAIRCDHRGKVTNFLMNDKCAAGTGRGMEVFANLLSIPIEKEFCITGGIAKNEGIVKRIETELGIKALKPKHDTQIAGALGAALFAKALAEKERGLR